MIIVLPSIKEVSCGSSVRWPVLLFHTSSLVTLWGWAEGENEGLCIHSLLGSEASPPWLRMLFLHVSSPMVWRRGSCPSSGFLSLSGQGGRYPNACFPVMVSVVLSDGAVSWKEWSVPGANLSSPNPHMDHFTVFCCEGPPPRGSSCRQVQVQLLVQNLDHFITLTGNSWKTAS